jgi:TrpR family transcriptional regulator, trp operon repressor
LLYYRTSTMKHKKYFDELIAILLKIKTEAEMSAFLSALLTPQESEQLPKRIQIIKMLKQGLPQREISEKLNVGIATVTRGTKELKSNHFKNIEVPK